MNHVTSDIAGAAGDQDRHARGPLLSPGVAGSGVGNIRLRTCMHVLEAADKSRENRSLPLGEGEGVFAQNRLASERSPSPGSHASACSAARHPLPPGERVLRRAVPAFAPPACGTYHDHAIESAFAVSHRQDDRSGCLRALHNRLRIYARIPTSPLQCWHRASLHHTSSLMLPLRFRRVGYRGDKNERANRA
jgi:hypothetical protein